jgi:glutathione S-transferase
MIRLWGRTTSSNVMKVLWTLEELHLPFERIDAGGAFGRTNTPDYRSMNPLGLVPSIEDGGLRLFESNSIIRYLCNAYAPASTLYPAAPGPRAEVESWMDFQQTAQSRPASTIFLGLVRTPAGEARQRCHRRGRRRTRTGLGNLRRPRGGAGRVPVQPGANPGRHRLRPASAPLVPHADRRPARPAAGAGLVRPDGRP